MSDNLIGIIVAAIIATGGGIIAYFKWLDSKSVQHQNHKNNIHFKLSESQQKARDTVWEQMQDLAAIQGKRIEQLVNRNNELVEVTRRIRELEDELYDCRCERRKVIKELAILIEEKTEGEENGTST
jgi:septal ring factor EnvC (AmiA/AmiB activator)